MTNPKQMEMALRTIWIACNSSNLTDAEKLSHAKRIALNGLKRKH